MLAIGFDAFTGPLYGLGLTGASGTKLQEAWRDGVRTYLGMMTTDFPNFFMVGGPQSPALASNVVMTIEQAVDWIADLIEHARDSGATLVETTVEGQNDWVDITEETVAQTLYATTDSWYRGSNVQGKPNTFMGYVAVSASTAGCAPRSPSAATPASKSTVRQSPATSARSIRRFHE